MSMFERVKEYIQDNEFRLTLFEDRIHIINYVKILSLEAERISILTASKRIVIKGEDLVLNRLLECEVLILGNVFSVEVFYE